MSNDDGSNSLFKRVKKLEATVNDTNSIWQELVKIDVIAKIRELESQLATSNKKIKHLYNWRAIYTKNSWDWFNKLEGVLRQLISMDIKWLKSGLGDIDDPKLINEIERHIKKKEKLLSDLDKARQGNSNPCIDCKHEVESCTLDWNCFFEAKSGKRDGARPNCDNCEYLKIKNPHCMECSDFSHWRQQKKPPTPKPGCLREILVKAYNASPPEFEAILNEIEAHGLKSLPCYTCKRLEPTQGYCFERLIPISKICKEYEQKKVKSPQTLEELSMDKEFIEKVNRYLHLSDQTIVDIPKKIPIKDLAKMNIKHNIKKPKSPPGKRLCKSNIECNNCTGRKTSGEVIGCIHGLIRKQKKSPTPKSVPQTLEDEDK